MFRLSDNFWRRLNLISGIFVLVSTFGLLVFMAHLEIKDLDLWLHIGVGRYIIEHNFQVPTVDILSCTVAGIPWVNHEWLFQVIVASIYNNWGVDGLLTMQVWLVSITLLLLVILGYGRKNQLVILFALFLVSLVYQTRFTIRPELFSLLFFAGYVVILAFFIDRKWSVWALFLLQVLWANIHGFFFFGPLIVLITLLGEWLKRHVWLPWEWKKVGRLNDKEFHRTILILAMVCIACFLTPTGVGGAFYPLKILFDISGESKVFFTKIVELQKPITKDTIFSMAEWPYYRLMIIVSFLTFFFNRKKIDIGILIFWLFFLFFSLAAIRNIVFFSFAAYLAIVANLTTIRFKDIVPVRFTDKKFIFITAALAQALIVVWALDFYRSVKSNGYFDFDTYERKSEFGGISQRQFPAKAVEFLVKNKVKGNFLNDFNSGAYLVGHCFPDIKVFIDGRTEVYGPQFFQLYRDILEFDNVEKLTAAIRRFQINGILINTVHTQAPKNVISHLYKDPDWALVYFDYDGMIFLRNIPVNHDVISRHRIDLTAWKPVELDLFRLGSKDVVPYRNLNRAFALESLDFDDAAIAEAKAALKVDPGYVDAYKVLGKIAGKKKDFQAAYEYFRTAAARSFGDQIARMNMALALVDLRRFNDAAIQYQKIVDIWPGFAKAYLRYAKVQVFRKDHEHAFKLLQKGYDLNSDLTEDVLELGDLFLEQNLLDLARKSFELVVLKKPENEKGYLKSVLVYEKTKERDKAVELLKKGLKKNPESKELKEKLRSLGVRADDPVLKK